MKPEELDELLEKFERAETTLEEERRIKAHFTQNESVNEHDVHKSIFSFYAQEQKHSIPDLERPKRSGSRSTWMKIAAILVLLIASVVFYQQYQHRQELKRQLASEAFDKTKKVLELVATEFQKGKSNLELLKDIDETKNEFIK